jgi:hypothetical protein
VSNVAFWINAATFRATGLDPARNVPRTWDQLARLGQKLAIRKNGKAIQEGISLPLYDALRDMLVLDALQNLCLVPRNTIIRFYLEGPRSILHKTFVSITKPDHGNQPVINCQPQAVLALFVAPRTPRWFLIAVL